MAMTPSMANYEKEIVEENCSGEDRISSLRDDVIECIMNGMSARDAARTCVLSSRWKDVWANHPSVILDRLFWDEIIVVDIDGSSNKYYPDIVKNILQHHAGYIRKFVFRVPSVLDYMPHTDIDSWLSSLCRKGLKELTLYNFGIDLYRVPCSVLSSSDLIDLRLSFCLIESGCFTNLKTLCLVEVTFDSNVVLTTPVLTTLVLNTCYGILHFDISAPRLECLNIFGNRDLNLKPFLTCMGIRYASLLNNTYFEGCERFCLAKLLAAWPRNLHLKLDGFSFKYLTAGSIPSKLGQLGLSSFSIEHFEVDSEQIAWILCILKNSPLLLNMKICFGDSDLNGIDIDKSRIKLDFQTHLETVIMKDFSDTPNEFKFAMILLVCAPVLKEMLFEVDKNLDVEELENILITLAALQCARPNTRIACVPY